jgi:hypothetical protein
MHQPSWERLYVYWTISACAPLQVLEKALTGPYPRVYHSFGAVGM